MSASSGRGGTGETFGVPPWGAGSPSFRALRLLLLAAAGCQADPVEPLCRDAQPIPLASGEPSGFERCADGAVNRVAAVSSVGATNNGEACHGDELEPSCDTDADCTAGVNGRCFHQYGPWLGGCSCVYACAGDADCASNEVCVPTEVTDGVQSSSCIPAACRTGADCASGECGLADYHDGCSRVAELRCRDSAADACHGNTECTDERGQPRTCDAASSGLPFACVGRSCVVGRPLRVGDRDRVAGVVHRSDWTS